MTNRDFVNVTKPTALQFWLARNGEKLQVAALILAMAFIGSVV